MKKIFAILPGVVVTAAIAAVATVIGHFVPLLGAALPAIVIGIVFSLFRRPGPRLAPGMIFSSKMILQLSVVLLGTQLSLLQVWKVGFESFPVMIATLVVCLFAAWLLGKLMGIDGELKTLIGVGTAICGASAIAAITPVIRAKGENVAYAVSTIFLFNIMAVLVFPPLGHAFGLSQHEFGLFAGTAVNDTSSVVATAGIFGSAALSFAVVVKLVRTLMIIPISVVLAAQAAKKEHRGDRLSFAGLGVKKLVPWFLVGFLLMSVLRSIGLVPDAALQPLSITAVFMISMAMAAIGLATDLKMFRHAGVKPLLLGAILWIIVTVTALAIILLSR